MLSSELKDVPVIKAKILAKHKAALPLTKHRPDLLVVAASWR